MNATPTSPAARVTIAGRAIGAGEPAYLIAEIGSNHNKDQSLARKLIDEAAAAGFDAVKFQLFRAAWLYPSNLGTIDMGEGPVDFFKVLEQAELPASWLPALKSYAESKGLGFLCTPFDEQSVAELEHLGVAAYKIASPELNHLPLLRAAAAARKPLICSSGLCTLSDIEEALTTLREVDPAAAVILLQCTTAYPTPDEQANLGVIPTLARAFGVPVGFSDHTMNYQAVPAVSVAVGGCVIEKHITLDRKLQGPDHPFAIVPDEMRAMVDAVRAVEARPQADRLAFVREAYGAERVAQMIGHGRKEIMPAEAVLYPGDKRSIHALRDVGEGEALTTDNVRVVRSERHLTPGLHPRHWSTVIGARATRPIAAGQGVSWGDLLRR